jgi:predicted lipoprotein
MMRALCLLATFILLCSPVQAATSEDYAKAVTRVVEGAIVPAFGALETATAKLKPATESFCQQPDHAHREALRAVFVEVLKGWAHVDFLLFGPLAESQRVERFAFWPDSSGAGARQLRRLRAKHDPALLDPQRLASSSAAIQGLPAFELLVLGDDAAAVKDYDCKLAVAIAANLEQLSIEMARGWTAPDGWRALMLTAGPDNRYYATPREAANEFLKAALTGFVQLRDQRLSTALGREGGARPEKLPYWRSGGTDAYLDATLAALEQFVELLDLPRLAGKDVAPASSSIDVQFKRAQDGLAMAGHPLPQTIATPSGRAGVQQVLAAMRIVQDLIGVQLAPAAGLSVGFNALDGD